jgi:AraC-like DNA-binding protein
VIYPQKLKKNHYEEYLDKDMFRESFDTIHTFLMQDYSIGMHYQEFFEINIVTDGEGMHYIGDNRVPAKKRDVFIITPMIHHGYVCGEGLNVFHVLISKRFMEKNISDLQKLPAFFHLFTAEPLMRTTVQKPRYLRLGEAEFEMIDPILKKLLEYHSIRNLSHALIRESLTVMLITLLSEMYSKRLGYEDAVSGAEDDALMQAIAYINEYYYTGITISELATMSRLSRSSFIRKFNAICKMSPAAYIKKRRIEASEILLTSTSLSIADIAEKCGFYDASHFTKIFVQEKNVSPSKYRKQHVIY